MELYNNYVDVFTELSINAISCIWDELDDDIKIGWINQEVLIDKLFNKLKSQTNDVNGSIDVLTIMLLNKIEEKNKEKLVMGAGLTTNYDLWRIVYFDYLKKYIKKYSPNVPDCPNFYT